MLNKFPGNFFNMHTMSSQVAQLVKYLSACKEGDLGLTPESGKSPGKENGNPLQYSCWRFYGQRSLEDYSPWDMDTTEWLILSLLQWPNTKLKIIIAKISNLNLCFFKCADKKKTKISKYPIGKNYYIKLHPI